MKAKFQILTDNMNKGFAEVNEQMTVVVDAFDKYFEESAKLDERVSKIEDHLGLWLT